MGKIPKCFTIYLENLICITLLMEIKDSPVCSCNLLLKQGMFYIHTTWGSKIQYEYKVKNNKRSDLGH